MRYSAEHKSETHGRIVRKAAEEFRRHGLSGIGVSGLMSALGLTHGGFYAHFTSKDALIDEATVCVMQENLARMLNIAETAPEGRKVQAIIDVYISPQHRDNPSAGCALPALASELARKPKNIRKGFTKSLDTLFDRLSKLMPGESAEERKDHAIALFTAMAGAVLVSRAVNNTELSDRILRNARQSLVERFAG